MFGFKKKELAYRESHQVEVTVLNKGKQYRILKQIWPPGSEKPVSTWYTYSEYDYVDTVMRWWDNQPKRSKR